MPRISLWDSSQGRSLGICYKASTTEILDDPQHGVSVRHQGRVGSTYPKIFFVVAGPCDAHEPPITTLICHWSYQMDDRHLTAMTSVTCELAKISLE
jgi:hypothetical protein